MSLRSNRRAREGRLEFGQEEAMNSIFYIIGVVVVVLVVLSYLGLR